MGDGRWTMDYGAYRLSRPAVSAAFSTVAHRPSPVAHPESRKGGPKGRPFWFPASVKERFPFSLLPFQTLAHPPHEAAR
jgi:hypothetical protein